jgi:hypothetical protein
MSRTRRKDRRYLRNGRYYADFRDLGGKLEALKPPGEGHATGDPDVATALVAARVKELESIRRGIHLVGRGSVTTLASFAVYHLKQKRILAGFRQYYGDAFRHRLNES